MAYGVLPALSPDQHRNIAIAQEREPTNDLSSFLDAAHFGRIVARNHAAAFADAFTDYDVTRDRFRFLASMRNEWAHVPDEGLPLANVNEAVRAMIDILVRLRSREALEIERMSHYNLATPEEPVRETVEPGESNMDRSGRHRR